MFPQSRAHSAVRGGYARATEDFDISDTVEIGVSINGGGTAVITPMGSSPAPEQSAIVLENGQCGAFREGAALRSVVVIYNYWRFSRRRAYLLCLWPIIFLWISR